jgi:hypothetical protein
MIKPLRSPQTPSPIIGKLDPFKNINAIIERKKKRKVPNNPIKNLKVLSLALQTYKAIRVKLSRRKVAPNIYEY